jgi:hypothetical protein
MIFLPIVERELRVASRRWFTYWSRLLVTLGGVGLAVWILFVFSSFGPPTGAVLFRGLAILSFIYAGIGGIQVTSDCLSKERRESTLGLLFLTDLTGYDIVLGKLAATGVSLLYAVVALMPVLAVALVLGAVTSGDVFRVGLVSLNLLFFFCSLGLAASALCRQANASTSMAIFFTVVLNAAWLVGFHAAVVTSPICGCFLAFDNAYHLSPFEFWVNMFVTQLYGWGFLWFACWFVPRSWQDASQSKEALKPAVSNAPRRRKLLEENPYLWRASRPEIKRLLVWLVTLAAAVGWLVTDRFRFRVWDDLFILILTGTVFKIWLASEASWIVAEDRRQGGLQLLLTTLLEPEEIISGHRAALWRQFAWPVAVLLAANVLFLTMEVQRSARGAFGELVWLHLIAGGSLVLEMVSLSWVAIWQGLINRKSNWAVIWAMLRIVAAPYLLFFALLFLYATSGPPGKVDWTGLLIFPGIFGVGVDFFFALGANSKLLVLFRTVAAEGYERKRFAADDEEETTPMLAEVK